jgi:hypothetical protein
MPISFDNFEEAGKESKEYSDLLVEACKKFIN